MPLGLPFDMVGFSGLCGERNTKEVKIFFAGVLGFLCVWVLLTKEKVVFTTLCTTSVVEIRPKTPSTSSFWGSAFKFLCTTISSVEIRHWLYFQNNMLVSKMFIFDIFFSILD